MVTVIHALNETSVEGRWDHIEFWHGVLRSENVKDESVVCWCGGKRFDLSETVCVVWHLGSYYFSDEGVLGD